MPCGGAWIDASRSGILQFGALLSLIIIVVRDDDVVYYATEKQYRCLFTAVWRFHKFSKRKCLFVEIKILLSVYAFLCLHGKWLLGMNLYWVFVYFNLLWTLALCLKVYTSDARYNGIKPKYRKKEEEKILNSTKYKINENALTISQRVMRINKVSNRQQ